MSVVAPYPELDEYLVWIGEAGWRISEIEASEGSAGNISVCLGWPVELRRKFPLTEPLDLPLAVPELAGMTLIIRAGAGSDRLGRAVAQSFGRRSRIPPSGNRRLEGRQGGNPSGKCGHLSSKSGKCQTPPWLDLRQSCLPCTHGSTRAGSGRSKPRRKFL